MKFNLIANLAFQGAGAIIQLANAHGSLVPAKYHWLLAALVGVAQAVISIKAHYTNPDGTSAALPYDPDTSCPKA